MDFCSRYASQNPYAWRAILSMWRLPPQSSFTKVVRQRRSCMKDPDVLNCDNHLLVLNKPSGMLSHQMKWRRVIRSFWKRGSKEKFEKPGNVFLHVVHRLDREVSASCCVLRTSKALARLNAAMRHETKEDFKRSTNPC